MGLNQWESVDITLGGVKIEGVKPMLYEQKEYTRIKSHQLVIDLSKEEYERLKKTLEL